jgi:cbb3-type cytochrome oxidase maturation protein
MDWFFYAVTLPIAVLFLASAVYALYWASKNGQLRDFDKGAASIFDDEEPVGQPTDFFPGKAPTKVPTAKL